LSKTCLLLPSPSSMLKLSGIVSLVLLLAYPSMAAPQALYCLSRVGSPKPKPRPLPESDSSEEFHFRVRNIPYRIVIFDRSWLQLLRSNYILGQVNAPQIKDGEKVGGILELKLDRYGWLWINGSHANYIAPLTFTGQTLTLGKPALASERLVSRPCSYLENLIFACPPAETYYSPTLKQIFVTGHEVSLFGVSSPRAYIIVRGKPTPLQIPDALESIRFHQEVPVANGILFRGRNQEVIFYDGQRFTTLLSKNLAWRLEYTLGGKRAFLIYVMRSQGKRASLFLQELTAGTKLTPIPTQLIPNDFRSPINFFTLPKDTTLWAISEDRLFAKVNGRLQRVFTFSKPMTFDFGTGVWQTPDGAIGFTLKDSNSTLGSDGGINYFLRRTSQSAKCEIPISVGGR
jgi:hypothetical protein